MEVIGDLVNVCGVMEKSFGWNEFKREIFKEFCYKWE